MKKLSDDQLKEYEIVSWFISRAVGRQASLAEGFNENDADKLREKRFILNQREGHFGVVSHKDPIIAKAIIDLLQFSEDLNDVVVSALRTTTNN